MALTLPEKVVSIVGYECDVCHRYMHVIRDVHADAATNLTSFKDVDLIIHATASCSGTFIPVYEPLK